MIKYQQVIGLIELYQDLTESDNVFVNVIGQSIEVKIISSWFKLQSPIERQKYLFEGIETVYPELLKDFKVQFIALTPNEVN